MDERLRANRLRSLGDALRRLEDALAQPKTEWTRDAAIQRFEFSFELVWKAVSAYARSEGLEARSPREAVRVAHRLAWIEDDGLWLRMLDDRNRTSHIYNEAVADEIFSRLGAYAAAMGDLRQRLAAIA
jgi:nucleotidyltransferase substrate binding protein (TIGR01987 family)